MQKSKKIMLLIGIELSLVVSTSAFSSDKKTIECVQVSPKGDVTKGVSTENVKNGYSIVGNVLTCKMKK